MRVCLSPGNPRITGCAASRIPYSVIVNSCSAPQLSFALNVPLYAWKQVVMVEFGSWIVGRATSVRLSNPCCRANFSSTVLISAPLSRRRRDAVHPLCGRCTSASISMRFSLSTGACRVELSFRLTSFLIELRWILWLSAGPFSSCNSPLPSDLICHNSYMCRTSVRV